MATGRLGEGECKRGEGVGGFEPDRERERGRRQGKDSFLQTAEEL